MRFRSRSAFWAWPGLVELRLGLVHAGAVELGVDDEERLALLDIGTLGEEHAFEVSLHAGADLHELLGADAADVFAVDVHVLGRHGLYGYDRELDHGRARTEDQIEHTGRNQHGGGQADPAFAVHPHADVLHARGRPFQFGHVQLRQVRFESVQVHIEMVFTRVSIHVTNPRATLS